MAAIPLTTIVAIRIRVLLMTTPLGKGGSEKAGQIRRALSGISDATSSTASRVFERNFTHGFEHALRTCCERVADVFFRHVAHKP
ncbi:hypothetical protein DVK44_19085 [Streptomyces paludis]|uniref:Uncharacterized protein n=1 Tax=Streptomyces paludis TaxID=2282738 RepID=A0A345HRT1_9ACTN|nr:hypothetical protein DVK44_19085 [Streptomyces paludis]